MAQRPKDIGTRAETQTVRYLQSCGWVQAERRALHGNVDLGDITGIPGLCWEVKGGEAAKTASDGQIAKWLEETAVETANAGAEFGFLVVQRHRKNVGAWWAVLDARDLARLVTDSPSDAHAFAAAHPVGPIPVRLTLAELVELLRAADWAPEAQ